MTKAEDVRNPRARPPRLPKSCAGHLLAALHSFRGCARHSDGRGMRHSSCRIGSDDANRPQERLCSCGQGVSNLRNLCFLKHGGEHVIVVLLPSQEVAVNAYKGFSGCANRLMPAGQGLHTMHAAIIPGSSCANTHTQHVFSVRTSQLRAGPVGAPRIDGPGRPDARSLVHRIVLLRFAVIHPCRVLVLCEPRGIAR